MIPNLGLVRSGRLARPAPPIRERPELLAAFERGEADRDADDADARDPEEFTALFESLSRDERAAYLIGRWRDEETMAPPPLWLAAPVTLGVFVAAASADPRGPRLERWSWYVFAAAWVASGALLTGPTGRRRGRALGLTRERHPIADGTGLGAGVLQNTIMLAVRVVIRLRTGRWPRVSPQSYAAAGVIGDLAYRRSWNAARAATQGTDRPDRLPLS